jgi:hypothetical protein
LSELHPPEQHWSPLVQALVADPHEVEELVAVVALVLDAVAVVELLDVVVWPPVPPVPPAPPVLDAVAVTEVLDAGVPMPPLPPPPWNPIGGNVQAAAVAMPVAVIPASAMRTLVFIRTSLPRERPPLRGAGRAR